MAQGDTSLDHYVIHGGEAGKKRLDLLAAIMEPSAKALLARMGLGAADRFLDLGCGGGHVSLLAAHLVGPNGSVTGLDLARLSAAGLALQPACFFVVAFPALFAQS